MHTHPTLHIYKPISILYMQELIEHDIRGHVIYHSLSHCWESIWIMRRSTCQTLLCWHMDCSPNTYIHLKGGRGRDKDREHTHRTAGYLHVFFNHIPRSLNRQSPERCRCCNAASITSPPPWEIAALRSEEFWDVPFEEHKAQLELFEQMFFVQKSFVEAYYSISSSLSAARMIPVKTVSCELCESKCNPINLRWKPSGAFCALFYRVNSCVYKTVEEFEKLLQ